MCESHDHHHLIVDDNDKELVVKMVEKYKWCLKLKV